MAKPPSVCARRISKPASMALVSRASSIGGAITGQGGEGELRPHEGAGAAPNLFPVLINQAGFGDIDAPLAADPAPLGAETARSDRPGEQQVEGGGQKETIRD